MSLDCPERTVHRLLALGPAVGGVADSFSHTVTALGFDRKWRVEVWRVKEDATPLWSAVVSLGRNRRIIADADVLHVEFGSNDRTVFWLALLLTLRRAVVAVVHDYPTLVKHPGAGVLPSSTRLTSMLGYRVMSPLLDDWLMRLFLRRAACVAVLSDEARIGWRDGVRGGLVVIPHGSFPVSDRAVLPSMGRYVLFAGYIGQSKGVDLLLRAWEKIASASPLELVIAGESQGVPDPELERLRVRAESLPSPPRWVGFVASERELQDLIAKAAVVVLPYRKSSPASGILARAMLEGRAIVVSSVPATRTTIHDQLNGLLVAPGDVAELTDALRRMIEDPALRDRLGASARACADRVFSSEIQSGRLASAYERLLADKRVSG